ncbi:hypothetical protein LIPSTDRAFT_55761, partial [Lipomyces starkeyi NRRL Y-11557]
FEVGDTQSTRIIVDSTQKSTWRVTAGKQEWVTVLEFVNGAGCALPPKAQIPIQHGFLRLHRPVFQRNFTEHALIPVENRNPIDGSLAWSKRV